MVSSLVYLIPTLLLLFHSSLPSLAQTPSAPAPSPSGSVNFTGILDKAGQYTTFIRLLNTTQVSTQLENQLNNTNDGFTIFAPADNAFKNLKPGAINGLSINQQVALVLYNVVPKFYSLSNLLLVGNPVRTQASGQDGGVYGLNFTGQSNHVKVSTGVVETQVNNALYSTFPLAVYQVDEVHLPKELFWWYKTKTAASPLPPSGAKTTSNSSIPAPRPSPSGNAASRIKSNSPVSAPGPSPAVNAATKATSNSPVATPGASPAGNAASGKNLPMGSVGGLGLLCMGIVLY